MRNRKPVLPFNLKAGRRTYQELAGNLWYLPPFLHLSGEKNTLGVLLSLRGLREEAKWRGEGEKGTLPLNKNRDIVGTRRPGPKRRAQLTAA